MGAARFVGAGPHPTNTKPTPPTPGEPDTMTVKNIYTAAASDELQFGPHGTFAIASKITKSARKRSEQLEHQLEQLRRLADLNDETVLTTDEQNEEAELVRVLDEFRPIIGEDGDTSDAIAYVLCQVVTLGLENATDALAGLLYADYDADVLGIDQLAAAAAEIGRQHERRMEGNA